MKSSDGSRLEAVRKYARESRDAIEVFFAAEAEKIVRVADLLAGRLKDGGKILLMGNGGSAADAQHLAAELVGRYLKDRAPLAAVALTTDSSILTAVGNDYGFESVFERQVAALCRKGDAAIGISTSGSSANVLRGLAAARQIGALTVGMAGRDGGKMPGVCDHLFIVHHDATPVIQQVQITLGHALCRLIEDAMFPEKKTKRAPEAGKK